MYSYVFSFASKNLYEYDYYSEDGADESEDDFAGPSLRDLGEQMFLSKQQKDFQRNRTEVSNCLLNYNTSNPFLDQAQSNCDKYCSTAPRQKLLFHSLAG
jgi:hypothetical protein